MRITTTMTQEAIAAALEEAAGRCWGSERLGPLRPFLDMATRHIRAVMQLPLTPNSEEPYALAPLASPRPESVPGPSPMGGIPEERGAGELHELTASQAVWAMRGGELSPVEYLQALLERIDATDSRVNAWVTVDAEGAMAAARDLEARRGERRPADLLFGLPVGLKDVFHARGLPTMADFEPYQRRPAIEDAGAVRHLREAGAIILGKNATVPFAFGQDHPRTRNPWNLELSPGGSSSGSGAAVAARQVPASLGTQTGGSGLRPAAYCGAVAIKPTFGRLSRHGLLPGSWSLDNPAILVRSVADAALLLQALARHDPRDPFSVSQPPEDFVGAVRPSGPPPRLGLLRDLLDRAEAPVRQAAETAAQRLADAGAEVREVRLPVSMDLLLAAHTLMVWMEATSVHAEQHARWAEHYPPRLRCYIEVGQLLPITVYAQATRLRRRMTAPMAELVSGVDAVLTPTVSNLPPGPHTTGDASFQTIWSMFGFPSMTLPTVLSPEGLPHAVQLAGRPFQERSLLRIASWCESLFGRFPAPPLWHGSQIE